MLTAIVAIITAAAKIPQLGGVFRVAPVILWVFLVPAVLTSVGCLPETSEFYDACGKFLLPSCLVLFLLATDVRKLRQLGGPAIVAVGFGAATVVIAGTLSCLLFRSVLGENSWKLAAPLVGGWVGGYTSLIVVKESVQCSDDAFSPLLLIASLLAYSWIAVLSCGAQFQERFDRWVNASDVAPTDNTGARPVAPDKLTVDQIALWVAACLVLGQGLPWIATFLPTYPPIFSVKSNGFLLLLIVGIILAMFRSVNRRFHTAAPVASYGLLLLIAVYGAKCNLADLLGTPLLGLFGLTVLLIHLSLMLLAAKLFRIPLVLIATASQANIGGVASAPAVAGAYKPGSESIGVLMGMLAAKLGLPAGLLAAEILRQILSS